MTEIEEKTEKRLTPAEWEEATTLYELGECTIVDLSNRFGISASAFSQKFRKNGVIKGSRRAEIAKKIEEKVKESAADAAGSFASARRTRIEETKTQSYQTQTMIHALTHQIMLEAKKASKPFATIVNDLKALRLASAIIATTRQERYALLNADEDLDQNELPILRFEDLTADEIEAFQNIDEDDGLLAKRQKSEEEDIIQEDISD